jgi:hypothetical protein
VIALLLIYAVLALGSLAVGLWLASITGWPEHLNCRDERFAAAAWAGLTASAALFLAAATFTPVKPAMVLVLFLPLAVRTVRESWRECILGGRRLAVAAVLAAAVAFVQSGPERLYDAALYHNQTVRWIADYGIVPGLALIHYRLSFASSWFAAGALFDQAPWESRLSRSVNGVVLTLLLFQFVHAWSRVCRREGGRRDWYLVFGLPLLLGYSQVEAMNVSTSPNLGAAAAIFVSGWLILEGRSPLAFALAGGAFAIKLNAAPVVLAALARFPARVYLVAGLLASALFMANYRATGCPAFPAPILCGETEAGVGADAAAAVTTETRSWTRSRGRIPQMPLWEFSWLSHWARNRWTLIQIPPVLLALAAHLLLRRWTRASTLGVLGLVYFILFAADFRFGFGYAAAMWGAGGALAVRPLPLPQLPRRTWVVLVAAGLIAVCLTSEQLGYRRTSDPRLAFDPSRFVAPVAGFRHTEPPRLESINDVKIWRTPVDDRCGTLPIPCTPYPPNPTLRLCDPARGMRGGFCRKVD